MGDKIYIREQNYQMMHEDVIRRLPHEACGIVAGRHNCSEEIFDITNILSSPTRFRMSPEEQWDAFKAMEDQNLDLLAIYHSHPNGPTGPSKTDIEEFAYPGSKYLIWARSEKEWVCRAYVISEQEVTQVPIVILKDE